MHFPMLRRGSVLIEHKQSERVGEERVQKDNIIFGEEAIIVLLFRELDH
jgi:hypothetical protein